MRKFFTGVWRAIAFPFRLVFNIIASPFRTVRRFIDFLNSDPVDTPIGEIFARVASQSDSRNSLLDHIDVFRKHLLRSVGVLTVTVIAAFWAAVPVMEFLAIPIGGLEKLQAIQVTEEIGVFMRVAMMVGIAAAFPYISFELWLFVAPGLWSREKKMGLAGIPLAYMLFLAGMAFTFYVLLPAALPFLGGFTTIAEFWAAREYFAFVTGLMLWIGLFFEFPLVVYVLTSIGFVKPKFLAEQWRLAVVIIAVLAAAITPTVDPVNMGLVMIPMILLYFISIGLSYIAYAGRRKNQAEAQDPVEGTGAG
ncbi:MAG: twin-arginine translocase subunit TatC [Anaerolineales bacterium]|nr:twin-arginine translocase subunit TatC [Anaerolineales bacterium]